MKINEVELELGISKANIRFYEKQNLLAPKRNENGYRDYSQEDVDRLQAIIVLRKLGISIQDIEQILNGNICFRDAIQQNITDLETQIEQLKGALAVSRQIASEQVDTLDTKRYWDIIQQKEAQGEEFVDVVSDYWINVLEPIVLHKFSLNKKMSVSKIILSTVIFCSIYAIGRTFIWNEGNLLINFLYWPIILSIVAVITFPIFWIGKHHPKVASVLSVVLMTICGLFLATVLTVLVLGLFGVFR
jgi:DNA-binding transcriptional MerR regulator